VFVNSGRQWQCALCFNVNEVESEYFCELDGHTGKRLDYLQRPELSCGAIDIIAPDEYSLRPPPPPVFLFVIDVTPSAVRTGMVRFCCLPFAL
jgi:protein transport protein SEC24